MSGTFFKVLLLVSMLCNGIALVLVDGARNYYMFLGLRTIGSMVIPLATFLLVEGFHNTSDRKKYATRLFVVGFLSVLPFLYAMNQGFMHFVDVIVKHFGEDAKINGENYQALAKLVTEQEYAYYTDILKNCAGYFLDGMVSLAIALVMLMGLEKVKNKYYGIKKFQYITLTTLIMLGAVVVLVLLRSEQPVIIIMFTALFYFLRGNKPAIAIMTVMAAISFYMKDSMAYASGVTLAVLCIFSYNGQRGDHSKVTQLLFYAAYPLHYLLLYIASLYA